MDSGLDRSLFGSGNVTFDLTVNFVNGNGNTGDGYGTDSWSLAEEASDSDGDGWSDADEGACGTDANDSSAFLLTLIVMVSTIQ